MTLKATMSALPYMQNRELSWLKFNERVLQEANRTETPLLDRLRFISIFSSNLDEFFMVRVGTLTDYSLLDKEYRDNKTGMTAQQQLDEIYRAVAPLYALREKAFLSVADGLSRHGVRFLGTKDLSSSELKGLKSYFIQNIVPMLSPSVIDASHPIPHLANLQMNLAVALENKKGMMFGLVPAPAGLEQLIPLPGEGYRFVFTWDLIYYFADLMFSPYKVVGKNILRGTRSADIDTDDGLLEAVDYRQHMKSMLKKRGRLSMVRMELGFPVTNQTYMDYFAKRFQMDTSKLFFSDAPMDFSFCNSLERGLDKETAKRLLQPVHRTAETLADEQKDRMLKAVAGRDILFSYPFESITPFLEMLRQSADDGAVTSIKITLYRIDVRSLLAESLIRAAENGKEVVVLMELRARFDEANNIEWAERMEEAGCRVIYGLVGYKVHSKVCLITLKESGKIRYITHIGTGNYNEKTARQYTDLSLVTANQDIGHDASAFFSNLLLGNLEGVYKYLWVAPNGMKNNLLECITREEEKAKAGLDSSIMIKCNSLTEKEVIEKLVSASRCGVKITLIIRGICCLIPQIPELSENIRVISIVGKFLEHSRIFCFGTGPEMKLYISSADLMTRNLQRRVEVACPILDIALKDRLYRMLEAMISDNTQAWEQYSDGRYVHRYRPGNDLVINSQELFIGEARSNALLVGTENNRSHKHKGLPLRERVRQAVKLLFQG